MLAYHASVIYVRWFSARLQRRRTDDRSAPAFSGNHTCPAFARSYRVSWQADISVCYLQGKKSTKTCFAAIEADIFRRNQRIATSDRAGDRAALSRHNSQVGCIYYFVRHHLSSIVLLVSACCKTDEILLP